MPRAQRVTHAGALHHIMMRGNNKQQIFFEPEDYLYFCQLMKIGLEKFDHSIFAFCLMPNHVHLLVKSGFIHISKALHNLNFRFAAYYNYRHKGLGHVFQDRFKSLLIEKEDYLKNVLRYIHLNPIVGNVVKHLDDYHWSSYHQYVGRNNFPWVDVSVMCKLFHESDQHIALKKISQFTLEGIQHPACQITDRSLMDELYEQQKARRVIEDKAKKLVKCSDNDIGSLYQLYQLDINQITIIVCQYMAIKPKTLAGNHLTRSIRLAQTLIAKFARDFLTTCSTKLLAKKWRVTVNSLYVRVHRLEQSAVEDKKINAMLIHLTSQFLVCR